MLKEGVGLSNIAFLTLSANCKVEEVSFLTLIENYMLDIEGETQMINLIFPEPKKD